MFVVLVGLLIFLLSNDIQQKIIYLFTYGETLTGRLPAWRLCWEACQNNLILGFGYGIYNTIVFNATTFIACHNWFLSILGKGGIIYLLYYLGILAYAIYLIINIFKKNNIVGLALSFGFLLFFMHSFLEDNYNLVALVIVTISIVNNAINANEKQIETK